jgi:hypothetical protein
MIRLFTRKVRPLGPLVGSSRSFFCAEVAFNSGWTPLAKRYDSPSVPYFEHIPKPSSASEGSSSGSIPDVVQPAERYPPRYLNS